MEDTQDTQGLNEQDEQPVGALGEPTNLGLGDLTGDLTDASDDILDRDLTPEHNIGIQDLPRDILQLTFGHLDDPDLAAMCMANPNMARNICNNSFWLAKLQTRFGIDRHYANMVIGENTYWGLYNYLIGRTDPRIQQTRIRDKEIQDIQELTNKLKQYQTDMSKLARNKTKQLSNLTKRYEKTLGSLNKKTRSSRNSKSGPPVGFNAPVLASETFRKFIRNGNFGPVDPNDPNSPPINRYLQVGQNGVASRTLLTLLMSIYAHVNDMHNPMNRSMLTSTEEMDGYFQGTYGRMKARPVRAGRTGFDEKNFKYSSLMNIIADNIVKNANLTQYQQDLLKDPITQHRTELDLILIRKILGIYRDRAKAARK